jgi:hypothetical protein
MQRCWATHECQLDSAISRWRTPLVGFLSAYAEPIDLSGLDGDLMRRGPRRLLVPMLMWLLPAR